MNNELLEEEVEIIYAFRYEMDYFGHKGYYSFYDEIDNGYLIYKENNMWVYKFYDNGLVANEKKYTNLYNLCLDLFFELQMDDFYFAKMDLRIPRGTKVIISKSTDCPIDEIRTGTIIDSEIDKNTFQSERIYKVLGDDGMEYFGVYGMKIYNETCFLTLEDYLENTKEQIAEDKATIRELHDTIWSLYSNLESVNLIKDELFNDNENQMTK